MPALQFFSPEAADAKWLIWGKILHRKGTRGTKYPEPNVRVQITDNAIRVSRDAQTFYYSGVVEAPCQCRTVQIAVIGALGVNGASDRRTLIALSDGTELASIPYSLDEVTGVVTNYAPVTAWSGDGWIQLFDSFDRGTSWVKGARVAFSVPSDVCFAAATPAYPVAEPVVRIGYGNFVMGPPFGSVLLSYDVTLYLTAVVVSTIHEPSANHVFDDAYWMGVFDGASIGVAASIAWAADVVAWNADWVAARGVAILRERPRAKSCSDNLKTNLKAGVVQDQIKGVLRSGHLVSTDTYQSALMTANIINSSSGSGDDITNTKTVTLSYQGTDSEGNPVTLEEVVTGTQRIVITHCANSSGTPNAASYTTTTLTNWMPISSNGSTGAALDYTYQRDSGSGMAQIQNGTIIAGASSLAATFDNLGGAYSPPYIQSSDNRTITYPQLYIDYRAATARRYGVDMGNTSWLDSVFKTGETIDIFPLSVIHSEYGDLGVFPQGADISDTSKLTFRADMMATVTYNYNTGAWTGSGADLVDADGSLAPITIPYSPDANTVFRSRAVPWKDLQGPGAPLDPNTYDGQKADMAANPGDYPLFIPLLTV